MDPVNKKLNPYALAGPRPLYRMTYLLVNVYEEGSELNLSDQITIPLAVWEMMTGSFTEGKPTFVDVEGSEVFGRIVPGSAETVSGDACLIPRWMLDRLGIEEERWICLDVVKLPTAGVVTLRAREEATLTESEDPVTMLSEVLSASWSCLSVGSALPLVCGTFDVIGIEAVDGSSVSGACILDTDVNLELIPALDHVDTPIPFPVEPEPEPVPMTTTTTAALQRPQPRRGSKVGFVPFSGVGRRTCDP